MPASYVSVETIKGSLALVSSSTANDTRLRALAEDISRQIDRWTGRTFQPWIGTIHFGGDGSTSQIIKDLISVSTLLEDTNLDGTFETGWASTDYLLGPFEADPTSEYVWRPYTVIYVRQSSDGTQDVFLRGQRNYRLVGTWGYGSITVDSGLDASASFDSTATTIAFSGGTAAVLDIGWTILVGSEQMYVKSKPGTGTGTSVVVERAVNGSTATVHASGTAISYFLYPGPIQEAALAQVSRLVKRAQTGFVSQLGMAETGQIEIMSPGRDGLDPDVRAMLASFRRLGI